MNIFLNSEGKVIVEEIIKTIQQNKEYLSDIDGAIGDGDHGINMNKGFTMCEKALERKNANLSESFITLGDILITDIGGSMGPIYGTIFIKMGKKIKNNEEININVFSDMLNNALTGLMLIVEAKVGDKTLMDTLVPAINGFDEAKNAGLTFSDAIDKMIQGAETGKNSTIDLVAKLGRASRLGERSRGVLDAGATSCYLILKALGETVKTLLK